MPHQRRILEREQLGRLGHGTQHAELAEHVSRPKDRQAGRRSVAALNGDLHVPMHDDVNRVGGGPLPDDCLPALSLDELGVTGKVFADRDLDRRK